MKQKQVVQWIAILIALIAAFFMGWFGNDDNSSSRAKSDKRAEKQIEKTAEKDTALKSNKAQNKSANRSLNTADYDFVMRNDAIGANPKAKVDYYMLALSWSPAFCAGQQEKYGNNLPASAQIQCGVERQYGWVIHGLWPQNGSARGIADHPRFCQGDLPAVEQSVLQNYLGESPSFHLLQGEWEKHGACAFDSAEAYFKKQQELYRTLTLPTQKMNRKDLFRWVKQHNPALKNAYLGASRDELFICYDLNWQVMDCK
ncbi:ribonuclease [Pasteurellaceae bacterium Pebbles2]|nr:ribonuclease [Pasteurellaceae bacterium Pebbles2]